MHDRGDRVVVLAWCCSVTPVAFVFAAYHWANTGTYWDIGTTDTDLQLRHIFIPLQTVASLTSRALTKPVEKS